MKALFMQIISGWNVARATRLGLGLAVSALAIFQQNKMMAFMGLWLTITPLLNVSCCGSGGCDINHANIPDKSVETEAETVTFEEVKPLKK